MTDIHCRKCNAVVLRFDDSLLRRARGGNIRLKWPGGEAVGTADEPKCPQCGDEFKSVNPATWETLGVDDLALLEKTRHQLRN